MVVPRSEWALLLASRNSDSAVPVDELHTAPLPQGHRQYFKGLGGLGPRQARSQRPPREPPCSYPRSLAARDPVAWGPGGNPRGS